MGEFLKEMNVFVLLLLVGQDNGAKKLIVYPDKHGMELTVYVSQDIILMEACVFFVSMDKNGMLKLRDANAQNPTFGLATSVRKLFDVQENVFIMKHFSNVSALKTSFGMDFNV